MSLPLWERGLKLSDVMYRIAEITSLPLWERGLKFLLRHLLDVPPQVAPLVGAWIEIYTYDFYLKDGYVAPLVGAWIEIWNMA